jgi:hypothetical protein
MSLPCDELCPPQALAVLLARRSFLTDRPHLRETPRVHCRASGKVAPSSDRTCDQLIVRLHRKRHDRHAKRFIKERENISKETVIQ